MRHVIRYTQYILGLCYTTYIAMQGCCRRGCDRKWKNTSISHTNFRNAKGKLSNLQPL